MNIIVVDFETFYSQAYSLSKLTTEEYIRSPEFEVIGVSVKLNDADPEWFSGSHSEVATFLAGFPWGDSIAVAHNAMFDMAILNWRFGIRPKRIACTLAMGRALHGVHVGVSLQSLATFYNFGAKGDAVVRAIGKRRVDFSPEELDDYGAYCSRDVALCWMLFDVMARDFPTAELRLIDLTTRMFTEPVLELDRDVLHAHLQSVRQKQQALMERIDGMRDEVMSNQKLALALESLGVVPPTKISRTTGKETYAFAKSDEAFKELLEHPDLRVQALVSARLGLKSTIEETRTQRFLDIQARGALPVPLRYYAAHTGRWGGSDKINLQNVPRTSPLKKAIRAPDGYVMIDSDSSQIEARTLAWLAGQDDLVAAFDAGDDVYKIMASAIYGKPEDSITPDERFVGKQTVLGAGYGMGGKRFRAQLKTFNVDVEQEECDRIIAVYRQTYPMIPMLWKRADRVLACIENDEWTAFGRHDLLEVNGTQGILLPNKLRIAYPNLRREENDEGKVGYVYDFKRGKTTFPKGIWGGSVIENVCQALARIVIGEQMLMVAKRYRVVLTVHDAVGALAAADEATTAKEYIMQCMRRRPSWAPALPLNCEAGAGPSYGECK